MRARRRGSDEESCDRFYPQRPGRAARRRWSRPCRDRVAPGGGTLWSFGGRFWHPGRKSVNIASSAGVAQLVRACGSYPQGPGFKSLHRHHFSIDETAASPRAGASETASSCMRDRLPSPAVPMLTATSAQDGARTGRRRSACTRGIHLRSTDRTDAFDLQSVHQTLARRALLADGDQVAVALSGGSDSVVLTLLLRELNAGRPGVSSA